MDKLNFNPVKGWESEIDFPNYQDEASNREMMNRLHFQTRDFINNLVTLLESCDGANEIGSYPVDGLFNLDSTEALTVKEQIEALKRISDTKVSKEDDMIKEAIDNMMENVMSLSNSEIDTICNNEWTEDMEDTGNDGNNGNSGSGFDEVEGEPIELYTLERIFV